MSTSTPHNKPEWFTDPAAILDPSLNGMTPLQIHPSIVINLIDGPDKNKMFTRKDANSAWEYIRTANDPHELDNIYYQTVDMRIFDAKFKPEHIPKVYKEPEPEAARERSIQEIMQTIPGLARPTGDITAATLPNGPAEVKFSNFRQQKQHDDSGASAPAVTQQKAGL